MNTFGERLKEACKGTPLRIIAADLGVAIRTMHNYYNDEREPKFATLCAISALTETNLHWLLTGEGPKKLPSDQVTSSPVDLHRDLSGRGHLRDGQQELSRLLHKAGEVVRGIDAAESRLRKLRLSVQEATDQPSQTPEHRGSGDVKPDDPLIARLRAENRPPNRGPLTTHERLWRGVRRTARRAWPCVSNLIGAVCLFGLLWMALMIGWAVQ